MRTNSSILLCGVVGLATAFIFSLAAAEDPVPKPGAATNPPTAAGGTVPNEVSKQIPRVSLELARDRARLMHDIYSATLDAMHHRYFHGDRAVVPARAMEDVFKDIERRNYCQTRWISASFNAMSVNHDPQTEFEKQAARRIAKGEEVVEVIEDGYYRRAGSIPLTGGCVSCHAGFFANTPPTSKFAGLIVSIPVDERSQLVIEPGSKSTP